MQTSPQTLQAEAIQRTGFCFERGEPNESLVLGSPGQLAGGNEMKQNGKGREWEKTGWQGKDVTSGMN